MAAEIVAVPTEVDETEILPIIEAETAATPAMVVEIEVSPTIEAETEDVPAIVAETNETTAEAKVPNCILPG
jgi:hypothetical protein